MQPFNLNKELYLSEYTYNAVYLSIVLERFSAKFSNKRREVIRPFRSKYLSVPNLNPA